MREGATRDEYTCRGWWEPILFSPRGAEVGWLCLKCWCIHQYRNGSTMIEDRALTDRTFAYEN